MGEQQDGVEPYRGSKLFRNAAQKGEVAEAAAQLVHAVYVQHLGNGQPCGQRMVNNAVNKIVVVNNNTMVNRTSSYGQSCGQHFSPNTVVANTQQQGTTRQQQDT